MNEQPDQKYRIACTGGGTGGHVYPGLAVVERLSPAARGQVCWIGSSQGMERHLVEEARIPYVSVSTGKLRRYFSLRNFTDPFRVIAGFFQARCLLRRFGTEILFSKGGFVAVPVVYAARTLGIPVLIHESDVEPGLATRLTAPRAEVVFISHEAGRSHLPPQAQGRAMVTGNPVREAILAGDRNNALNHFGVADDGRPLILVLGGSLGARQINELVWEAVDRLCDGAFVVHQWGRENKPERSIDHSHYIGRPYFVEELADLYARADIVVARAGAGIVAEIAATARPAVLLPLSARVSRGDQIVNAELHAASGAAVVLDSDNVDAAKFVTAVLGLVSDAARRTAMSEAARNGSVSDAAATIAALIEERV